MLFIELGMMILTDLILMAAPQTLQVLSLSPILKMPKMLRSSGRKAMLSSMRGSTKMLSRSTRRPSMPGRATWITR